MYSSIMNFFHFFFIDQTDQPNSIIQIKAKLISQCFVEDTLYQLSTQQPWPPAAVTETNMFY